MAETRSAGPVWSVAYVPFPLCIPLAQDAQNRAAARLGEITPSGGCEGLAGDLRAFALYVMCAGDIAFGLPDRRGGHAEAAPAGRGAPGGQEDFLPGNPPLARSASRQRKPPELPHGPLRGFQVYRGICRRPTAPDLARTRAREGQTPHRASPPSAGL